MTRRDVADVVLRLLAVYWFFSFAPAMVAAAPAWGDVQSRRMAAFAWLLISVQGFLAWWLFAKSKDVARWIAPDVEPSSDLAVSQAWQALALAVLGVYFAFVASIELTRTVARLIWAVVANERTRSVLETVAPGRVQFDWPYAISVLAQLAGGLLLFFRASNIAQLWHSMRPGGQDGSVEQDDSGAS